MQIHLNLSYNIKSAHHTKGKKMTDRTKRIVNIKLPKLAVNKWLLILLIFVVGFLCLIISRQIEHNELLSLILDLFGAFLVVAVPLEILKEIFFEAANKEAFAHEVSQLFDEKIDAELIQARKFGLDRIENSFPLIEMFDSLQPGDTLWWLDTFCPGHKTWLPHVKHAIARGASINMLVLDPDSSFCSMRAKEIGDIFTDESFVAELRLFISDFEECRRILEKQHKLVGHFDIVRYNDLLGVPCYVVTRNDRPIYGYSSMYLTQPTGVEFPHFCWTQGGMCEILFIYIKGKYDRAIAMAQQ